MFRKIGDALSRFMSGRYGTDSLNKALLIVTAVLEYIRRAHQGDKEARDALVTENMGLIWSIVRMYSRNVEARRRENARWIGFCNRVKDRDNRYFKCPRCRQMVRVPRGKGTINIRCPKCGERFLKKT